jgi:hypothetical protein
MLVEICQDAIAIIECDNKDVTGCYTDGVQTCCFLKFCCDSAVVFVHDSGQLSITDICDVVSRYGRVLELEVTLPQDSCEERKLAVANHKKRLAVLEDGLTPLEVSFRIADRDDYAVLGLANTQSRILSIGETPSEYSVFSLPDKEKRQIVAELNNNFMELNSQSLEPIIQYQDGGFISYAPPFLSVDEMLKVTQSQPEYSIINYSLLIKGHQAGVINLPDIVLQKFAEIAPFLP